MPEQPQAAPNADEIANWNGAVGQRWTELQDVTDAMFAPLTEIVMAAAAAKPGERVLDIGCGCGATVLELARRVGPTGRVLGVDVSEPMLARAAERSAALANVELVLADASTHRFPATFDLVFSRFGVMFFDDPVAGFANIRAAMAPGGRLVAAVWRAFAHNAWVQVPWHAALPLLPPQPAAIPGAPGQFAFADPDHVRAVLDQAGFSDIVLAPHDPPIPMTGPGEAALAAERMTRISVVSRALSQADPELRGPVTAAIADAFARRETTAGLTLGGAIWLVSARR